MTVTKAGFDLSEISPDNWQLLLDEFALCPEPIQTDKGWVWTMPRANNFVVTANNPITGYYYYDRMGADKPVKGYVGYVGIQGDEEFVTGFFNRFLADCDGYKEAVFGRRPFI